MASIPCAAYQASHIHGNIRKQTQCRSRQLSGESNSSASPPVSPLLRQRCSDRVTTIIRISSIWPRPGVDDWQPHLYNPDSARSFTETLVNNVIGPLRKSSWPWAPQSGMSQSNTQSSHQEEARNKNQSSD